MAIIFSYAILQAIPNPRRGERVNVGIVVFLPDRIDVRFPEIRKARAIASGNWAQYALDVTARLNTAVSGANAPEHALEKFSISEPLIQCSSLGKFSIEKPEQYEMRVKEILSSLVANQRDRPKTRTTRINTEIANAFKAIKVLAKKGDSLDQHKVIRDYTISPEEDLKADFIAKNGVYHVTATLDLRQATPSKGDAAIKAIVLDKAKDVFANNVQRLGVYAAPHDASHLKPHINLLKDYADDTFNWMNPDDQRRYTRSIYSALITRQ